jgi:hypothetical protein
VLFYANAQLELSFDQELLPQWRAMNMAFNMVCITRAKIEMSMLNAGTGEL